MSAGKLVTLMNGRHIAQCCIEKKTENEIGCLVHATNKNTELEVPYYILDT